MRGNNTRHASTDSGLQAHPGGLLFCGVRWMKFTKPALSLDAQIDLLVARGLEVNDRESAKHALAHGNYYRLRGYWIVLEDEQPDGSHKFRPGSTLEQALGISEFDEALRNLVIWAASKIEVSLRTQFALHIANAHGAHAYLDAALFTEPTKHAKCLLAVQEEVDRSHEIFIQHYRRTYSEPRLPPLWAACEVMSLGSLSKWYENLAARADRKAIADTYDLDEAYLASFLHHLTTVRNACAHQARLWNRRFTVTMKVPRNRPVAAVRAFFQGQESEERRLYNSLTMMAHLMGVIAPGNDWLRKVRHLVETSTAVHSSAMGFPDDWKSRPLWRDAS